MQLTHGLIVLLTASTVLARPSLFRRQAGEKGSFGNAECVEDLDGERKLPCGDGPDDCFKPDIGQSCCPNSVRCLNDQVCVDSGDGGFSCEDGGESTPDTAKAEENPVKKDDEAAPKVDNKPVPKKDDKPAPKDDKPAPKDDKPVPQKVDANLVPEQKHDRHHHAPHRSEHKSCDVDFGWDYEHYIRPMFETYVDLGPWCGGHLDLHFCQVIHHSCGPHNNFCSFGGHHSFGFHGGWNFDAIFRPMFDVRREVGGHCITGWEPWCVKVQNWCGHDFRCAHH